MWKFFFRAGLSAFVWLLDNRICPQLTFARNKLASDSPFALILGPLTQLHGWWHVLSSIAANFQTNYVAFHRRKILGTGEELEQGMFTLVKVDSRKSSQPSTNNNNKAKNGKKQR